jgi:hypothetical protein
MPSKNPRMLLVLNPETFEAIDDLSKALGKPKATIVAEFLKESTPNFVELARIARHFKLSPSMGLEEMQETVGRMAQGLAQAHLGLETALTPPQAKDKS